MEENMKSRILALALAATAALPMSASLAADATIIMIGTDHRTIADTMYLFDDTGNSVRRYSPVDGWLTMVNVETMTIKEDGRQAVDGGKCYRVEVKPFADEPMAVRWYSKGVLEEPYRDAMLVICKGKLTNHEELVK